MLAQLICSGGGQVLSQGEELQETGLNRTHTSTETNDKRPLSLIIFKGSTKLTSHSIGIAFYPTNEAYFVILCVIFVALNRNKLIELFMQEEAVSKGAINLWGLLDNHLTSICFDYKFRKVSLFACSSVIAVPVLFIFRTMARQVQRTTVQPGALCK